MGTGLDPNELANVSRLFEALDAPGRHAREDTMQKTMG